MKVELVPIASLKADPQNARRHSKANIAAILESYKTFGQQRPLVALADGTVIAGNGTLQALKEAGWKEVWVKRFEKPELARAYAIADNRTAELAEWDMEALIEGLSELPEGLSVGFSEAELGKLLGSASDGLERAVSGLSEASGPAFEQMTFVLTSEQVRIVKKALVKAKPLMLEGQSKNSNGNGLEILASFFLEQWHP